MNPSAIPAESSTPPAELDPLSTRPLITDRYTARNTSSNMMIPRIISVSGLAVRRRSTSTLATIALDEMVVIPAAMSVSLSGHPSRAG